MSSDENQTESNSSNPDDSDLRVFDVTQGYEFGMSEDIPDGTVLFLNDIIPDELGDVLVASLNDSPVHIISSSPPLSTGEYAPANGQPKAMRYAQFEDVRILSDSEFSVLIYDYA